MAWGEELTALAAARGPALVGYAYLLTGDLDRARNLVREALVRVYGRPGTASDLASVDADTRRLILDLYLGGGRRGRTWGRARHLSAAPGTAPADIGYTTLQQTSLGLPLKKIRAAARRRRIRFGAWVTVAAAAVVGVLVLAAAAAGGLINRGPLPPVDTPDATVPVAWDVDYSLCGESSPQWDTTVGIALGLDGAAQADNAALLTYVAYLFSLGADAIPDTLQIGARTDAYVMDLDAVIAGGPSPVVGVMGVPKGDPLDDELVPWDEDTTSVTRQAPLFSCRVQDGVARVEPGAYRLTVGRVVADDAGRRRATVTVNLTVPEPAGDGLATLPATPLTGAAPECGATFEPPPSGASDLQVAVHTTANARTWAPEGTPRSSVDATVTLVDTAEPGRPNRELTTGTPIAFLTRDGVMVDFATGGTSSAPMGARFTSPLPLVPGTTRQFATAFLGFCPGGTQGAGAGLKDGAYAVWVLASLGDGTNLVAGPWPLELTAGDWAEVGLPAFPAAVPILDERVLRAEAHAGGARWRATLQLNDSGVDGYAIALDALTDAGFTLDLEAHDPTRPLWEYAELSDDSYLITLEVSNETGVGFYADYVITQR